MATSEEPASPAEQPRLSDRQWEVLGRVVEGESVAPEKGKRIDLTLNSLVNRDLIEEVEASGKPTVYRATAPGQKAFEIHSKPAEPKAPEAEKNEVPGAGGPLPSPVFAPVGPGVEEEKPERPQPERPQPERPQPEKPSTKFVPQVGQYVYQLDENGKQDPTIYRVEKVFPNGDVQLSMWIEKDFFGEPGRRRNCDGLRELTAAELEEVQQEWIAPGLTGRGGSRTRRRLWRDADSRHRVQSEHAFPVSDRRFPPGFQFIFLAVFAELRNSITHVLQLPPQLIVQFLLWGSDD